MLLCNSKQTYLRVEKEEIINELSQNDQPMPKLHNWSSGSDIKYGNKHNRMQSVPPAKLSMVDHVLQQH